eukprot:gene3552-6163_t
MDGHLPLDTTDNRNYQHPLCKTYKSTSATNYQQLLKSKYSQEPIYPTANITDSTFQNTANINSNTAPIALSILQNDL